MDKRLAIKGIFWILDNGANWKDLPSEFGSKSAVMRLRLHQSVVTLARRNSANSGPSLADVTSSQSRARVHAT